MKFPVSTSTVAQRHRPEPAGGRLRLRGLLLAATLLPGALAQGEQTIEETFVQPAPRPDKSAAAAESAPRETVTEELIRLLAERFALAPEDADRLIRRLRDEQAAAASKADTSVAAAAAAQPPVADPKGRVRVVYIPETEKKRLRAEVRDEVLATARAENWAQPFTLPAWVKSMQLDGDLRLRQEFDFLDPSNSPQFINFQAVNTGSPLNTNPPVGQPLGFPVYNTTEDRQQPRYRARIGLLANVSEVFSAGLRFTTGNTGNPVSTNQTLGTGLNKSSFVIDRAWMNYRPDASLSLWGGRMPNPWLSTELVWDEDLGFDGIALQHTRPWGDALVQHSTLGVFSLENTEFNYPSTSLQKGNSRDKWLLGAQSGLEWQFSDDLSVRAALAFYEFEDVEGELSSPCYAPTTAISCDSDGSRPLFMQRGNTLFALRDLVVLAPTDPTYQYFGLASEFRVVDLTARIDRRLHDGEHLVIDADLAYNLGYDAGDVRARIPVNNFGPCPSDDPGCAPPFDGGNTAFMLNVLWGVPKISERGQWNLFFGYRRLESDALVDAFTDSDFHLGGTNAKGYHLGGAYGIAHNAWLSARWLSATEVTGAPMAIDVLFLDLNARF